MRNAILVAFVIGLTVGPAAAQTAPRALTLEQAVARVLSDGFDLRRASADAALASADARSAQSLLRAQLGISANAIDANEPQLGMPVARQGFGAASLSIPLFNSSNIASAHAAQATAIASQSSLAAITNDVVLATIVAYRRVQLAQSVLDARGVALTDQQRHLRLTEQRVAVGKAARYLTLRDRAALATVTQAQEDASVERDQAANDLAALLDLPDEPIVVEPLTRIAFSDSRDAVLTRAQNSRPDLTAATQRVDAAKNALAAARGAYTPTATLLAQSYNGASSPSLGRSGGQVQITASLPIMDGGLRSASILRAKAQYDRALAARDEIRAGVTRDVANAGGEFEEDGGKFRTETAAETEAQ